MNFIDAIILGIVEGITEFLPVSSTGHLILTSRVIHLEQTAFLKSFEIAIQLGAILSVIVLYGKTLIKETRVLKRILTAFVPTAIIGFILYKIIKKFLLGNSWVVVWALFLGGVFLIVFEWFHKDKKEAADKLVNITYPQALIIGVFQALAVVPGVSRSAATIVGGLLLGLSRKTIVEFSFLLAIPTMLAATAYDLMKNASVFTFDRVMFLGVGFSVSFIVALVSIKFLLYFIKKYTFTSFGVYRIIIAVLFWSCFLR